jgi:High potential iron-sulfur protein
MPKESFVTTRRQLIHFMPALPIAGLLVACGKKDAPAAPAATAPAEAPAAAATPAPSTPPTAAATPEPAAPAAATSPAPATAGLPLLDEKDPQATALGYVNDATKADKAKYPKYADGQHCASCALYQGGTAAQGGCPLYPGKNVSAKAWCSAYAKKAA